MGGGAHLPRPHEAERRDMADLRARPAPPSLSGSRPLAAWPFAYSLARRRRTRVETFPPRLQTSRRTGALRERRSFRRSSISGSDARSSEPASDGACSGTGGTPSTVVLGGILRPRRRRRKSGLMRCGVRAWAPPNSKRKRLPTKSARANAPFELAFLQE